MSDGSVYDGDYFLRGRETSKSLYTHYRWLPDLTKPMVAAMVSHLDIKPSHMILDFGCARGYVVRAFRELGYSAFGYDISQWALENADEVVKKNMWLIANWSTVMLASFDWVIAKDVLEHVECAADIVLDLMAVARKGVFAVVPLADHDGGHYVVREYEEDVTHIHRLTLASWVRFFTKEGWSVEASYRVPGVKCNYAQYKMGNGFITARRIK